MTVLDERLLDVLLRRMPRAVEASLDGETVVFQPDHESLTVLDPVGTVVWTLLDGTVSVRTLCEELADAYSAPLEQVRADVLRLVTTLHADELLVET